MIIKIIINPYSIINIDQYNNVFKKSKQTHTNRYIFVHINKKTAIKMWENDNNNQLVTTRPIETMYFFPYKCGLIFSFRIGNTGGIKTKLKDKMSIAMHITTSIL